jgi:ribosome biogenesis protein Tsr3
MFKTRTSNISNPDRKEKVCQPWAMVFDCQWKNIEIMESKKTQTKTARRVLMEFTRAQTHRTAHRVLMS